MRSGTWGSTDPDWGNGYLLAHEGLHLAGLPDQYTDVFRQQGRPDVTVPGTIDPNDTAALKAWVRQAGRDPAAGVHHQQAPPRARQGHHGQRQEGPHMLRATSTRSSPRRASTCARDPGDILANKSGDQQNLGVGAPLNMFARRGGTAHRDGLWAYCVDFTRHIPAAGTVLDVLGPAASLPGANMAQLQAVLEAVGRRQVGTAATPDGAQEAIWAVTDGTTPAARSRRRPRRSSPRPASRVRSRGPATSAIRTPAAPIPPPSAPPA